MYMYTPKSISNVTLFNNYIYLNISKTKNICNETLNEYIKYLNSVQVNPTHTDDFDTYYTQLSKMLIYKDKDLQDPINYSSYLEGLLLFNGNHLSDDTFTGWKFIDNICALSPEAVMFAFSPEDAINVSNPQSDILIFFPVEIILQLWPLFNKQESFPTINILPKSPMLHI